MRVPRQDLASHANLTERLRLRPIGPALQHGWLAKREHRERAVAQDVSQGLFAGMRGQPTSPSSIAVVGIWRSR